MKYSFYYLYYIKVRQTDIATYRAAIAAKNNHNRVANG